MAKLTLIHLALFTSMTLSVGLPAHASLRDAFDHYKRNPSGQFTNEHMQGWSGPSFHARNNTVDPRLLSITMPSWNAGCGGIDFHAGAFSIVTKDELVQMARGIAAGAPGYFFNLAMASVCPSCQEQMAALQRKLEEWNQLTQDSCNRFWDNKLTKDLKQNAENFGKTHGVNLDWLEGKIPDYGDFLQSQSVQKIWPDNAAKSVKENNPAEAMVKNIDIPSTSELFGEIEVEALFATIFGTTVVVSDPTAEAKVRLDPLKPLLNYNEILFNTEFGKTKRYACKDGTVTPPTCPNLEEVEITFEGLVTRNLKNIYGTGPEEENRGILMHIREGTALTPEQVAFMKNTRFPYEKVVKQFAEHPNLLPTIAEVLAFEIAKEQIRQFYTEKRMALVHSAMPGNENPGLMPLSDLDKLIKNADTHYEEAIWMLNDKIELRTKHIQFKGALTQLIRESQ